MSFFSQNYKAIAIQGLRNMENNDFYRFFFLQKWYDMFPWIHKFEKQFKTETYASRFVQELTFI